MILIVLDVLKPLVHKKILENELEGFGIRLNKTPPNIYFKRKEKGGINLQVMVSNPERILNTEPILSNTFALYSRPTATSISTRSSPS